MSAGQISNVTQRLLSLRKVIPSCFARKPRNLEDIDRWKATELRQFAVYTGKIVLKGILADQLYDHFMVFSVALSLLLCPTLAVEHNSYSKGLMKYFVGKAGELYGDHFMVYNVHSMVHLPEEAMAFGSLDACSAFPFDNYLGKLKRLVRSGKQPLIQVVKRLEEMSKSPLSVEASKPKFKRPNNAFILDEGKCCEAIEEREELDDSGYQMLLCKLFEKTEPLFRDPCDSRMLGCFKVQSRHAVMKLIPERQLTRKAIMMDIKSFAVVEFAEDSAVEIIPTSWLEETKEGTFCYWTFTNTRKLVKNCILPDKAKWRRCPLKKNMAKNRQSRKAKFSGFILRGILDTVLTAGCVTTPTSSVTSVKRATGLI
ncbi:hypothetical protein G5714_000804 [Onychostoma macrolepis]|uniref:Uncharacterized protein n=1 Tax=Onychostoma macrolepis TaxID=369639 RepID=A0A7J6DHD9_9TELE|nr:hypothetical protein G5714_000804 [Onychostoma macrolepis]